MAAGPYHADMKYRMLTTGCLALAACGARGADASGQSFSEFNTNINAAFQYTHLHYEEPANTAVAQVQGDSYLDKETGYAPGGRIGVSFMSNGQQGHWYGSLQFSRVVSDDIDYIGHFQNGDPATATAAAEINDWWLRLGKGFQTADHVMLVPHLGIGYHTWARGLEGQGYEYYSHKDWTVGGMLQYRPAEPVTITAMLAVGRTFGAHFEYDLVDMDTGLGSSPLYKAGLEIDYAAGQHWHLFLGVDYQTFSYGASKVVNGFIEPISHTELTNYNLGVRVPF